MNKSIYLFLLSAFIFFIKINYAQIDSTTKAKYTFSSVGYVKDSIDSLKNSTNLTESSIIKPSELDSALKQLKNVKEPTIKGYKIQLLYSSSYNEANNKLNDFILLYPDIPAELDYKEPNFRLKVGMYRTEMEATYTLKQIIDKYPGAYIVPEPKMKWKENK